LREVKGSIREKEWKGGNILEAQVSKDEKDCWEQ